MRPSDRVPVPRDDRDDYSQEMARRRREFVRERTGVGLDRLASSTLDPSAVRGNIENLVGAAQVPVGIAGPLLVNGEHARGSFYVPLATTEGALVASYSRGMRVLCECGGAQTTIVEQAMQRAPVFVLGDARQAREFGVWVESHFEPIREQAEATTRHGKLLRIEQYQVGPLRYLRFCYTTGDAAGQNMASKATLVACEWIMRSWTGKGTRYILSGNTDTDKKHSSINVLRSRGKRVVAEAVLRREVISRILKTDARTLGWARSIESTGALLAGSASNGSHAANGLAALFIATGQDAANVAESHSSIAYTQVQDDGDYYVSVTLPALIVASHGGGTGLPTQRECLEMMDCYGEGKAEKLAEICAATVLAGEVSLGAAVVSGDWVAAHERLARHRR